MNKPVYKHIMLMFVLISVFSTSVAQANECVEKIKAKQVYDAVDICSKMAKEGDVRSQFALGTLYFEGQGVMADKKLGFKWVKRAAESGLPVAQYNVGILFANGLGVEANLVKAYTWLYIADKYGYQEAKTPMELMAKELSKKELKKAVEAAQELLKKEDNEEKSNEKSNEKS